MDTKIEIRRGRTFLLPGQWRDGPDFTADTTLSCRMVKGPLTINLTVTKVGVRDFEIYASDQATLAWEAGTYSAFLDRRDPSYFPNGDPFVRGPEDFLITVI